MSKFHYIQEEVLEGVIVVDRCVATAVVNCNVLSVAG